MRSWSHFHTILLFAILTMQALMLGEIKDGLDRIWAGQGVLTWKLDEIRDRLCEGPVRMYPVPQEDHK